MSRPILALVGLLLISLVNADELKVSVLDVEGHPVPDVAVYIETGNPQALPPPTEYAVMDQVDTRFVPHILIVQTGTEVRFPNSDVVAHHVYSFSNPNDFMLPLYKGNAHPPVIFEDSGVVTLGCNIHDQMLGYILVVESQIYTMTDENGLAILPVSDQSAGTVNIWSPRINQKGEALSQVLEAGQRGQLVFRLSERLRPPHDSNSGALKWSDY
jgi:plastocyanin